MILVWAAFIPDIIEVLLGDDTGQAKADVIITPSSASLAIFGVSWRRLCGYTSSPKATEVSSHPISSITNVMIFGLSCFPDVHPMRGAARVMAAIDLSDSFMSVYFKYKLKNFQISDDVSISCSAQECLPPTTS